MARPHLVLSLLGIMSQESGIAVGAVKSPETDGSVPYLLAQDDAQMSESASPIVRTTLSEFLSPTNDSGPEFLSPTDHASPNNLNVVTPDEKPITLLYVRHGIAEHNAVSGDRTAPFRLIGRHLRQYGADSFSHAMDPFLTAEGIELTQTSLFPKLKQEIGDLLRRESAVKFSIVVSPLIRTQQTLWHSLAGDPETDAEDNLLGLVLDESPSLSGNTSPVASMSAAARRTGPGLATLRKADSLREVQRMVNFSNDEKAAQTEEVQNLQWGTQVGDEQEVCPVLVEGGESHAGGKFGFHPSWLAPHQNWGARVFLDRELQAIHKRDCGEEVFLWGVGCNFCPQKLHIVVPPRTE